MINKKRLITVLLALSLLLLQGCVSEKQKESNLNGIYPLNTDQTLKIWVDNNYLFKEGINNFGDTEFAKEYSKRTGVEVTYIHPNPAQADTELNMLIASGDLPDIIMTDWVSKNPSVMMDEEIIVPLNKLIDEFSPSLKKFIKENPELSKQFRTDDGRYYAYPFIRNGEKLLYTSGIILRSDWLKEFGLSIPETIDDWENIADRFKQKCDIPLAFSFSGILRFAGAFNTNADFYLNNGNVVYGPMEYSFRDFLIKMNEWYQKGYININSFIGRETDDMMLNDKIGACMAAGGSGLGAYLNRAKKMGKTEDMFDLEAAPFPTLEIGKIPEFAMMSHVYSSLNCAAITTACKNPSIAAQFLDYAYSEDGYMLNNFGIEGISYNMVDGEPVYTDLITNNPQGLSMEQIMIRYIRASKEGPFVQDERYIEQYYALPQQKRALERWSYNNQKEHELPVITLTNNEAVEYSDIMYEVENYKRDKILDFILGNDSLDSYNEFQAKLREMGIERAIAIKQAAVERYKNR